MSKVETLYKLTTQDGHSLNGDVIWAVGCVRSIPKASRGTELCLPGLLHVYRSPELALLRDPQDASYGPSARMWEVRGRVVADSPLKQGCHRLRVTAELPLPTWYTDENLRLRVRVRFVLLCWQSLNQTERWGVTPACEEVLAALRAADPDRLKAAGAAAAGAAAAAETVALVAEVAQCGEAVAWAAQEAAAGAGAQEAAAAARTAAVAVAWTAAVAWTQIDFDALARQAVLVEEAESTTPG